MGSSRRKSPILGYTASGALLGLLVSAAWARFSGALHPPVATPWLMWLGTGAVLGGCGYAVGRRVRALVSVAITDALTGIWNRRHFETRLREEIARADREGSATALLLIDVDNLKALNDTGGHQLGDRALRTVAEVLRGTCRVHDFAARYAGDEFVVLAPATDAGSALSIGERIRGAVRIAAREHSRAGLASLSVSVGVVNVPSGIHASRDALFAAADGALYRAKGAGRDCVSVAGHSRNPATIEPLRLSGQLAAERLLRVGRA